MSTTGFSFHTLASQDVAFREPLITFTRAPLMRGRLSYDGSKVQIRGFVNWTVVVLGVLFFALGIMFLLHAPLYAILPLLIFGGPLVWSYDVQRRRFDDLVIELTAQLIPPPNERLERTS